MKVNWFHVTIFSCSKKTSQMARRVSAPAEAGGSPVENPRLDKIVRLKCDFEFPHVLCLPLVSLRSSHHLCSPSNPKWPSCACTMIGSGDSPWKCQRLDAGRFQLTKKAKRTFGDVLCRLIVPHNSTWILLTCSNWSFQSSLKKFNLNGSNKGIDLFETARVSFAQRKQKKSLCTARTGSRSDRERGSNCSIEKTSETRKHLTMRP
jgi:hypothetical protein